MVELENDLLVSYDGPMQVIRFNRPKRRNAFRMQTYVGVKKLLEEAARNDEVSLTVITGVGDYFSSGNDLSQVSLESSGDFGTIIKEKLGLTRDFIGAFIDYPKVLVAVVNGPAIGVAVTILGLCDVVYATENATFHTPFTSLGISAEGCSTVTFPRIMGPSKAGLMLYFNHQMSAKEAQACGFVAQLVRKNQLPTLFEKLKEYAKLPRKSLVYTKRLIREREKELLHKTNEEEILRLEERFQSEDAMEAIIRFASRKKSKL